MIVSFAISIFISQALLSAEVVYIKGRVTRSAKQLNIGDKIKDGSIIETEKDSLAIISIDFSKVKIGPGSQFKILHSDKKKTQLELTAGSTFIQLVKNEMNKDHKLTLKTKTASMGVRGTQFFTSYGKADAQDVWMCVNEGAVEVKSSEDKKPVLVKKGEGIRVTKNQTSNPRFLPWTAKLNWNFDPKTDVINKVNIEEAYHDLLDQDYD